MARPTLRLCLDSVKGEVARDTAVSRAVLLGVEDGTLPATLRLSRPARLVAFSSRDRRNPGFAAGVEAAKAAGFGAVLRLAGGQPAVFTAATIAFALAEPTSTPREGIHTRFATMAGALRDAAVSLGHDARIGEVPGEYCPGEWSVNLDGTHKVAGVGQRLLRRSAHTGGVVVVDDAEAIRAVLVDVYAAMNLPWDPTTVGALAPGEGNAAFDQVRDAIVAAFATRYNLEPWTLDAATLERADALLADHRVD